jgi:poly-gamma-glutamate synthesis protein (capsule biosynthesis protein)
VRALDPEAAAAAVRAARAQADAVVVSIHWGAEYLRRPLDRQRRVAERLAEAGADLILGHHPHVLQPVEVVERGGHRTVVVYSMGNFVSNQDRIYHPDRFPPAGGDSRDGVAVQCRLVKLRMADGQERLLLADPRCEPLWTENNWRAHVAGKSRRREIRVIRVNAGIQAAQEQLDRLAANPGAADAGAQRQAQERLRTLRLRRRRAAELLGPGFVD